MFITKEGSLPYLYSTLLPVPHGFSTRIGGVSGDSPETAHLQWLNFGENTADSTENLAENYRRFTAVAGLPYPTVAVAKQVHGVQILSVTAEDTAALPRPRTALPEADGFFTARRGVTLCVKIADCIPMLLCSLDEDRPAVAALHGGWRGSAAGIAREGVARFTEAGIPPSRIAVAVGVGIGSCCFAVQEDFCEAFLRLQPRGERFLETRNGKCYADLKGLNREILLECGVLPEHIDVCTECSCCRPDRYFSHRATGGVRGTMAAMIALPPLEA